MSEGNQTALLVGGLIVGGLIVVGIANAQKVSQIVGGGGTTSAEAHNAMQQQINRILSAQDGGWPEWRDGLHGDELAVKGKIFHEAYADVYQKPTDGVNDYYYGDLSQYTGKKTIDTVTGILEQIGPWLVGIF